MERFNQRFEVYQTDDVEDEEPAQVGATVTIVDKKRRAAALQANFSSLSKANNLVHLVLADISKWSIRPEQLPQVFTKLSSLRLVQLIDAFSEEEGTQGSVINQLTALTKLTLERRAIERPIFPALTSLRHLDVDMGSYQQSKRELFLHCKILIVLSRKKQNMPLSEPNPVFFWNSGFTAVCDSFVSVS
jgi:hypothetical protein